MMILLSMLLLLLPPLLSFICYHQNRCPFSGRVAQHGDHVSRKRVLLGARSVSSDVVIEELKKHQHNSCMPSTHKENSKELPQKTSPKQRLVSNLPSGIIISALALPSVHQHELVTNHLATSLFAILSRSAHNTQLVSSLQPHWHRGPRVSRSPSC